MSLRGEICFSVSMNFQTFSYLGNWWWYCKGMGGALYFCCMNFQIFSYLGKWCCKGGEEYCFSV